MALIFYALAAPPLGIGGKNQCLMAATKGGGGRGRVSNRAQTQKNSSLRNKRSRDFYAAQHSFFFSSRDSLSGKALSLPGVPNCCCDTFFPLTSDRCFFSSSIKKCRLSEDCAELQCVVAYTYMKRCEFSACSSYCMAKAAAANPLLSPLFHPFFSHLCFGRTDMATTNAHRGEEFAEFPVNIDHKIGNLFQIAKKIYLGIANCI